jgi:hypothetical protein
VRVVDDATGAPVTGWEVELAWKPAGEEGFRPFEFASFGFARPGSAPGPDGFLAVPAAREPLDLLVDGSRGALCKPSVGSKEHPIGDPLGSLGVTPS